MQIYTNPIHSRLRHLSNTGQNCFSLLILERMYPNFALYVESANLDKEYLNIFEDCIITLWRRLFNQDLELDESFALLEEIVIDPDLNATDEDPILKRCAGDAIYGLCELYHAFMGASPLEIAVKISTLSIYNVSEFYQETNAIELPISEWSKNEWISEELDWQWSIYRAFVDRTDAELIPIMRDIRDEFEADIVSNLGVQINPQSRLIFKPKKRR